MKLRGFFCKPGVVDTPAWGDTPPDINRPYLNPAGRLSAKGQQTALLISVRSIEASLKSINQTLKSIIGWAAFFGLMLLIPQFAGCIGALL